MRRGIGVRHIERLRHDTSASPLDETGERLRITGRGDEIVAGLSACFPTEVISQAVWLYHVFSLSLRDP